MDGYDVNLGARLRDIRIEHNLTQAEFGKYFGVSETVVFNWEKGRTNFLADHILVLTKYFGLSPNDFLGYLPEDELSEYELFNKLLSKYDSDGIYHKYYNLPIRSKELVNQVIDHELKYVTNPNNLNDSNNSKVIEYNLFDNVIAAHGSESAMSSDQDIKDLKQDIKDLGNKNSDDQSN